MFQKTFLTLSNIVAIVVIILSSDFFFGPGGGFRGNAKLALDSATPNCVGNNDFGGKFDRAKKVQLSTLRKRWMGSVNVSYLRPWHSKPLTSCSTAGMQTKELNTEQPSSNLWKLRVAILFSTLYIFKVYLHIRGKYFPCSRFFAKRPNIIVQL